MISKMKNKIKQLNINWVIISILGCIMGVYSGLIDEVKALENTSFTDVNNSYEWWIFLSLIIIVSQKKFVQSGVKNFAFFAIAVATKVIAEWAYSGSFPQVNYVVTGLFLLVSFIVGMILNNCRKDEPMGQFLLAIPVSIVFLLGCTYVTDCFYNFPRHVFSMLFCFGQVICWIYICSIDKMAAIKLMVNIIVLNVCIACGWLAFIQLSTPSALS